MIDPTLTLDDIQAMNRGHLLEAWIAYTDNAVDALNRWNALLDSWANAPVDIPDDVFMTGYSELGDANLLEWADDFPVDNVDLLRETLTGRPIKDKPAELVPTDEVLVQRIEAISATIQKLVGEVGAGVYNQNCACAADGMCAFHAQIWFQLRQAEGPLKFAIDDLKIPF